MVSSLLRGSRRGAHPPAERRPIRFDGNAYEGLKVATTRCVRATLPVVIGTLLLSTSALRAQAGRPRVSDLRNTSHLGVGYVASIPEMFIGFTGLALTPSVLGGAGLYADVKLSSSSPGKDPYLDPAITVDQAANQFGDFLFEEQSAWLTVNLALAYALLPELAVYAGGGYSRERHYRQYFDNAQTRGLQGFYWIPDPAASGNRVNLLGGVLLRAGRYLVFQMGLEAQPRGADVGVMVTLPL